MEAAHDETQTSWALQPIAGEGLREDEPTRLALEWDGPRWAEIEPRSGYVVAVGEVGKERAGHG